MNRRFRAAELSIHDVAQNLAPWRGHVDTTSPRGRSSSLVPPRGGTLVEEQRRIALEKLHSYIWAACEYDHHRARSVFNRVVTTLDGQLLGGDAERGRPSP